VADRVVQAMAPEELVQVVRQQDRQMLRERAGLNDNQAAKLLERLGDEDRLTELEAVELIDRPTIELNDNGTWKETAVLSTGQKCTTILPILLIDSDSPLMIDQPEDNLDNRFVFETIVDSIRKVKASRQLIFVTHNPNIPVLGEAEQVFVMESDGVAGRIRNQGNVDSCQHDIVTLLEGGVDAFRRRRDRYGYQ
jgi:ABC-type cobalamin/Fe3+-siderophores transport system ATPase subunit